MLKVMEAEVASAPDGQVSLTDPDARAMATSGRGSGIVGYNVQSAVEGEHHLIVAHEVIMTGSDRQQLANMASRAKEAMGVERLMSWRIGAISPARKSWPARPWARRLSCRRR